MVASAAVKGEEGGYGILESPEPVIFPVHVDSGFVRPGNLSFCNFLTDHFVGRFGEFPHGRFSMFDTEPSLMWSPKMVSYRWVSRLNGTFW